MLTTQTVNNTLSGTPIPVTGIYYYEKSEYKENVRHKALEEPFRTKILRQVRYMHQFTLYD